MALASAKAERLRKWLAAAETLHRNRFISVTVEIAHKAGELLYRAVANGTMPGAEDALIAATADVRQLTVLSRNAKHMMALNAKWSNPLEAVPPDAFESCS